jgi:hypothetical protein
MSAVIVPYLAHQGKENGGFGMAEKTADLKTPDQAVVARAEAKMDAGDDLSKKEADALEEQRRIDLDRGYTFEPWKNGVYHYRSLIDHDTAFSETEIIRKVNEARVNAFKAANP